MPTLLAAVNVSELLLPATLKPIAVTAPLPVAAKVEALISEMFVPSEVAVTPVVAEILLIASTKSPPRSAAEEAAPRTPISVPATRKLPATVAVP